MNETFHRMNRRFRGFMPVVIDVETGGTDCEKNPLLEVAAVFIKMDTNGVLCVADSCFCDHVIPFQGSEIEKKALEINQIDPDYPLRFPREEKDVIKDMFRKIEDQLQINMCKRGILVGHNAHFDLGFINAASRRCDLDENNPLHAFSVFDTVSIGALAYGQTILSMACDRAQIDFKGDEAHSALYDARKTAELFCTVANKWLYLGGWDEALEAQKKFLQKRKGLPEEEVKN